MNRDKEALKYLEALCQENSKESHLYIQIGKIYAKIGQSEKALKCYNDAQELNPKNQNEIKNLIEQLHGSSSFMFP
jgi:tetratricopeptide (TPR) repeat protein